MKTLFALLLGAGAGALAWLMLPQPAEPDRTGPAVPTFTYGIGLIRQIDKERGLVTLEHGPLSELDDTQVTMSYPVEDRNWLAGLQAMETVEFHLRHDGSNPVVSDIRLRDEKSGQAGVPPACASAFRHSGRASLSQTARARSAAPPSAT